MWLIYSIRILLLINLIVLGVMGEWLNMVIVLSVIAITFIPEALSRWIHVHLTRFMQYFLVFFALLAQWGGTYLRAYDYMSWWDIFLHGLSAVLVAFGGIVLLKMIDPKFRLWETKQYKVMSWFLFMTICASAVFWEIFEFVGDTFFGTNGQLGSLSDTMEDMIICVVVGIFFASFVGWSLRCGKDNFVTRQFEAFKALNTQEVAQESEEVFQELDFVCMPDKQKEIKN